MNADDARAALDGAADVSSRLARGLRLPSYFHSSIGAAVAVQIGTATWAVTGDRPFWGAVLVAGVLAFFVVAAGQLWRFRRLNGAWVSGLASRAVLGTSLLSSVAYAAGFALAMWAGFADQVWLLVVVSAIAGMAYAAAGRRWWASYQGDPGRLARAASAPELLALVALAVAALVLLVVSR